MNEFHRQISNDDYGLTRKRIPLGSGGCEYDSHVLPVLRNRILRRDKRKPGVVYSRRDISGVLCHIDRRVRHRKHPQEHTTMVGKKARDYRRERQ